jgi:hypothetical protein
MTRQLPLALPSSKPLKRGDWQVAGIKCPFVHVDATTKSCQTTGKSPISPTKFARDHIAPIQVSQIIHYVKRGVFAVTVIF